MLFNGILPIQQMRHLLKLATPIIVAQLLQCANGFIDTLMAGWHSSEALSQVAIGTSLWLPFLILSAGVYSGASSLVSHAYGTNDLVLSRRLLYASIIMGLILSVVFVVALNLSGALLPLFNVPEHLTTGIVDYVSMVAFGFPALMVFWALRGWVEGLHLTRMAMITSLIAIAANMPLNALFIHGYWIIPAMGAKGCGIATALSSCVFPIVMLWLLRNEPIVLQHKLSFRRCWQDWDLVTIKSILRIGGPVGLSGFVEGSFFCVIAIALAPLGAITVAAHQITLNISSMLFMVPLGLNFAITVAVGKALGEQKTPTELRRLVHSGLVLAFFFALCSCAFLLVLRAYIPTLYTNDIEVQMLATELLLFAALFQLPDSLQVAAYGVLKGLQDTLIPMFIGLGAYWLIGATLGYSLTYFDTFGALGAKGAWIGLNIGLVVATLAFVIRLASVFRRLTHTSVFTFK